MRSTQAKSLALVISVSLGLGSVATVAAAQAPPAVQPQAIQHFHADGKQPSKFTVELRNGQKKALPFEDVRDLEENTRGLLAVPTFKQIMADAGNVAWDMESYSFLLQGKDFDSIHPSLQR